MNLVGTLAKVAMGVMVARGVGKMIGKKGGLGGGQGGLGGLLGGQRGSSNTSNQGGDLSSIGGQGGIGGLLGGSRSQEANTSASTGGSFGGGCSDDQGQARTQTQSSGGLGGLLEGLGGGSGSSGSLGSGGLGGLLGSVLSGGGKSGGLGGLLDSLGGKGQQSGGGLGGILNQVLNGQAAPTPKPDQNAEAEIMLRGMINAAKSDGQFDQEEQAKILEHLGDVTEEEINFVRSEMAKPLDVSGFIRSVPKGLEQQVYVMSLLGIKLDSQAEAQYLDKLARGLGISQQVSNQIHEQVGVPNLYG